MNLTQEYVAKKAGIGVATLKRIEHGSASTQLLNVIKLLHVLRLEQNLDLLVPDVPASPVQMAIIQSKTARKRARRKRIQAPDTQTWTWADDT